MNSKPRGFEFHKGEQPSCVKFRKPMTEIDPQSTKEKIQNLTEIPIKVIKVKRDS